MSNYSEILDKLEKLDNRIAGVDFTPKKDELREKIARVQRTYRRLWILTCIVMVEATVAVWLMGRNHSAIPDWVCALLTIMVYAVIAYPWKVVYK